MRRFAGVGAIVLVGTAGLAGNLYAQAVAWSATQAGPPTDSFAMAYDVARGRIVLFGGQRPQRGQTNETWERIGGTWTMVANTGPEPRMWHAMTYDMARRRVVLFGGYDEPTMMSFDDTWEWDGSQWTKVASSGPAPRWGATLCYDHSRGVSVLLGGGSYGNLVPADTWEWDGSTWHRIQSGSPWPLMHGAAAYDAMSAAVYVVFPRHPVENETWKWDGTNWTFVCSGVPSRTGHCVIADGTGRLFLHGGWTMPNMVPHNDTWRFDPGAAAWTRVATDGPPARFHGGMVYDTALQRTVLFGGMDPVQFASSFGDTWEFDPQAALAIPYGSGCGSPALSLQPAPAGLPRLGQVAHALLANLPGPMALFGVGTSRDSIGSTPLPLSLAQYGMPGCSLLQSCEQLAAPALPQPGGQAAFVLPIPPSMALLGQQLMLQGWCPAPGVNAAGLVTSNGLHWTIGI